MRKLVLLLALVAVRLYAEVPLPAAPQRYVTDAANVLDDAREHALNERLAQYARDTTDQILVYVDRNVPAGTTLEEMGAEAIRTWGPGQEKKDNGAILFLFVDDRQSRIEVGYGLEGSLTDAVSKRILVNMREPLRAGDYSGAVEQGVQQIFEAIADPAEAQRAAAPPAVAQAAPPNFDAIVFGFILLVFTAIAVMAVAKLGLSSSGGSPGDSSSSDWSSSSDSSWSSSSDSSSSSSSSDSSFSGGGGSGGGGGASDRW